MFGIKSISVVCCGGDGGDEEEFLSTQWSGRSGSGCWSNDKSTGAWMHVEKLPSEPITLCSFAPFPTQGAGASLQARLHILHDWATTLRAYHIKDIVHGNLTPDSVGVIHGRGTLINPSQGLVTDFKKPLDDDVYSARWAATELFDIDDDKALPTKMSDVYSFACLMLQMLTGDVPYCGTKRPEQVVYLKYLGREPIDAQTSYIADRHVAFMRWCWSLDPKKRPTMEKVVGFILEEIKRLAH